MKKRFSAFLLAALMVASLLPVMSMATTTVQEVDTSGEMVTALANGGEIKLTDDIEMDVQDAGYQINKDTVIDGNGHSITFRSKKGFRVAEGASGTIDVEFKNLTINNAVVQGRCLNIRNSAHVTLDHVTLNTTSTGNNQPVTLGVGTDVKLDVKNSTINGGVSGYGIMSFIQTEINVINTEINCYGGAIYMKEGSAGSVVNVTEGSVLNGVNTHAGNSNGFAVIVCEDGDITINVVDSTIKANCTDATAPQYVVSYQKDVYASEPVIPEGNTLNLKGNTVVNLESDLCRVIDDEAAGGNTTEIANATVTGPGAAVEENKQQIQDSLAPGSAVDAEGNVYMVPVYGGPPMNWVKCSAADNGIVKSGPLAASEGATITLYPKAATGYVLDTVEVLDAAGNAVAVEGLKFKVPAGGVTVNATFKLAE